jgi:hypothetical protein
MNLYKLKPHPFSQIFPPATGDDYDHLVASVKKMKKLRYKIIVYQNMILDGNQRIRACREARIEPTWIPFEGTDEEALDTVWDLNAGRRNMTISQKAIAAAKFATLGHGEHGIKKSAHVSTLSEAAEKAGLGKETIKQQKRYWNMAQTSKSKRSKAAEKLSPKQRAKLNDQLASLMLLWIKLGIPFQKQAELFGIAERKLRTSLLKSARRAARSKSATRKTRCGRKST